MTISRTIPALCVCLMLSGCGAKHGDRPAVHPVSGKLLVAGKPAANAEVILYPAGAAEKLDPSPVRPHATVEAGRFLPSDHVRDPGRCAGGRLRRNRGLAGATGQGPSR